MNVCKLKEKEVDKKAMSSSCGRRQSISRSKSEK